MPAGERGFDLADADPGAARGEQGGQDGLADTAGGLAAGKDVGAGQGVDGGVQGDGEAGAVGVGAGDGLGGECHLAADGLVEGEQGPDFLVQPGGIARAQDPAVQQGVAQREVGDLVFPALVVEAEQRGGRVAVVIGEGSGEPVPGGEPGPVGEGDRDLGVDDPDGQGPDPGQVGAIIRGSASAGSARQEVSRARNRAPVAATASRNPPESKPRSVSTSMSGRSRCISCAAYPVSPVRGPNTRPAATGCRSRPASSARWRDTRSRPWHFPACPARPGSGRCQAP